VRDRLAHLDVAVHAGALQHDPHPIAQLAGALLGVVAEDRDDPARAAAIALEDLDGRGLARAVGAEQPEHLARRDLEVDAAHGLVLAVALVEVAHEDRGCR
jgi:hypothetical protein